MDDLHISERLRKLLPPLTPDERLQLVDNIHQDGHVTDPLLIWHDGKHYIVVDGMHRWEIVRKTDIPYTTRELKFESYEQAEIWMLDRQLGRRNLLRSADIRKLRGELYNRLKTAQGGDHTPQSERAKCQIDTLLSTSGGSDAAEEVARKAGVSKSTVKRDGARAEAMAKLTRAASVIAERATDADVKRLAALSPGDQDTVARAVRTRQAASITDAIKASDVKPQTPQRTPRKAKGHEKPSAAKLVDALTKRHIGHIARELTRIAEINGGEGAQFKSADAGLNQLIRALQQMRDGKK